MTKLTILGAGGHGRVVADLAEALGYQDIQFHDARYPDITQNAIWPVTGIPEMLPPDGDIALGIGSNPARMALLETMFRPPVSLIHPSATVSPHAQIGIGSIVCAGAVVGPFAVLGRACIVNTGASVDHDCTLGDGVHISPGARLGGGVQIGTHTWVGIGAAVREYLTLGTDVMVGAGAAVTAHVPDGKRVGGVPAKEF